MVATTPPYVEPYPDVLSAGPADEARPRGPLVPVGDEPAALSLFVLAAGQPARQLHLEAENPLCRLAACTAAGAMVCNKGCGLSEQGPRQQSCPFGLLSVRASLSADGSAQWMGRRFPSVAALHRALDQLAAAGIPEEVILANLPPNPLMDPEDLLAEAERHVWAMQMESGGKTPEPTSDSSAAMAVPCAPALNADTETADAIRLAAEQRLGNLLEYLAQIHSLMATAQRADIVCDRFLRALAGALPFSEMDVYLRIGCSEEFIISASVDHKPARTVRPQEQACRLVAGELGHEVVRRGIPLQQRAAVIDTLQGPAEPPDAAAYPLFGRTGELLGVWVARHRSGAADCTGVIGREWARFMSLLAGMLAGTLEGLTRNEDFSTDGGRSVAATQAAGAQPLDAEDGEDDGDAAPAAPARSSIDGLLHEECARSARHGQPFALARLLIEFHAPAPGANPQAIEELLREALRPYDQLVRDPRALTEGLLGWWVLLPGAGEQEMAPALNRLTTLCEDALDAMGGLEELGARVGIGVTLWGSDAVQAEALLEHAAVAARQALRSTTGEGPVRFQSLSDFVAQA